MIFHDIDHVTIRCDDYDFMLSLIDNYFVSGTNVNHCYKCREYCQALTDFSMFKQTKERMQTVVILKATPIIVSYVHQKRRVTTMTTSSKQNVPVLHWSCKYVFWQTYWLNFLNRETCYGLAANQQIFDSINQAPSVHKIVNLYAVYIYLYFLVDPSHLLKTISDGKVNN